MALNLFSFFHLNLAFSSIEEESRPEVIRRCYWPMLKLARRLSLPIGIEASGYTLEVIADLDPAWIAELRTFCQDGPGEFIGSGYAQLIGPLVPAEVNRANQQIGQQVYERLLGFRPGIALVNEQAYSAGMVEHYREAGYKAIIMEWDNSAQANRGWDPAWRYYPQVAQGGGAESIPVIWNKAIPFQKFQRYAHGEMVFEEYLDFLHGHSGSRPRTFAMYGNDAEIFDYRPGRFKTEAALGDAKEWDRIARLYEALIHREDFRLIAPSQVLDFFGEVGAGHELRLESPAHPVPVKKQAKYNVTRWALTGRDDLAINTDCWRICEALKSKASLDPQLWKELCYLWSSDFRTHITEARWEAFKVRLSRLLEKVGEPEAARFEVREAVALAPAEEAVMVERDGNFLVIETACQKVRLNCCRGLAIEGLWHKKVSDVPLLGTLPHGYFDDIHFGADFFTGHLVLEMPGQHKLTDLSPLEPSWRWRNGTLVVTGKIATSLGPIKKEVVVHPHRCRLDLIYHFAWPQCPAGALRLGHFTLNPEAFDRASLFYRTHNGGGAPETFTLSDGPVNHLSPVSALVSANQGTGVTAGVVEVGDARRSLRIETDKCSAAVTGHLLFAPVSDRFLFRWVFSAQEMDDTSGHAPERTTFADRKVRFSVVGAGG